MVDIGALLGRRIVSPTTGTINMSSHQGLGWITASSGDTFEWRVKNWRAVLSKELADVIVSGCRRSTRGPTSIGLRRCPPARIADTPVHGARGRWLGDTRAYGAPRQVESDKGFLERSDDATPPSGVRELTTSEKALGTFLATFAKSRSDAKC